MRRFLSGPAALILKVAAAAGIVAYLIHLVEWENAVASARSARLVYLVTALAMMPANLLLEVWLWHRLAVLGPRPPAASDSVAAVLCGHAAGLVTPARSGEVFVRALYSGHGDAWFAGTLALLHRMLDFLAVVLISLPACVYFVQVYEPTPSILWGSVLAIGWFSIVILSALLIRPRLMLRMLTRLLRGEAWRARLAFLSEWSAPERWRLVSLAAMRYMVYVTQFAFLLHAFSRDVAWGGSLIAGAVVFYGKLLVPPITFTDVGIREGVSVYVAGFLAISAAAAFNAAFTLFVINLVIPAAMGTPLLFRSRSARRAASAVAPERRSGG